MSGRGKGGMAYTVPIAAASRKNGGAMKHTADSMCFNTPKCLREGMVVQRTRTVTTLYRIQTVDGVLAAVPYSSERVTTTALAPEFCWNKPVPKSNEQLIADFMDNSPPYADDTNSAYNTPLKTISPQQMRDWVHVCIDFLRDTNDYGKFEMEQCVRAIVLAKQGNPSCIDLMEGLVSTAQYD